MIEICRECMGPHDYGDPTINHEPSYMMYDNEKREVGASVQVEVKLKGQHLPELHHGVTDVDVQAAGDTGFLMVSAINTVQTATTETSLSEKHGYPLAALEWWRYVYSETRGLTQREQEEA